MDLRVDFSEDWAISWSYPLTGRPLKTTLIRRLSGAWFLALAAFWPACAVAASLVIPGGGRPEASLRAGVVEFAKSNPGSSPDVPKSVGIAGGLRALEAGESDMVRLARRLGDDELRAAMALRWRCAGSHWAQARLTVRA